VRVDGLSARPAIETGAAEWRSVARTQAAALSGMALYGIDGLKPLDTTVNADASIVRTVYQFETGGTLELLQQRAAALADIQNARQAVPTDAARTETARAAAESSAATSKAATPPSGSTAVIRDGVQLTIRSGGGDVAPLVQRLRLD
jgi:hypothetical protein